MDWKVFFFFAPSLNFRAPCWSPRQVVMKEVVKPQDGGEEIRRIRTLEAKLRELQVSPGPGKPFRAMKKGHLIVEVF